MAHLPKTLRNFSFYADGIGYGGRITEGTPPKFTVKTEDYEAGGLAGVAVIDMGTMEKLEADATIAEANPELHALLGQPDKLYTFRKAQGPQTQEETVIYQMRGTMVELETMGLKRNDQGGMKVKIVALWAKVSIAGRDLIEVDVEGNKRIVNGVDQMAAVRTALGE